MAEKEGFEPSRAFTPIGFRDRPLQPLGYFSRETKANERFLFKVIYSNRTDVCKVVNPSHHNGFEVYLRAMD